MNDQMRLPRLWAVKSLGELSSSIQYGFTAKAREERVGPKLLRITDIQDNSVNWSDVPFCAIEDEEKSKYLLRENDLVFARTGATVGKSHLIGGTIPESVFASYLIRVRLTDEAAPKYVAHFFQSADYWRQINESRSGIGQPNVNGKKLAQIRIPVAPSGQQKSIVEEIDKQFSRLDEAVANFKRIQANLKRYRASVLKAACEGRLVPSEAELARRECRSYETGAQLLARVLKERRAKWEADRIAKARAAGKDPGDDKWETTYEEPARPDATMLPKLPEGWAWGSSDAMFTFVTSGSRGWAKYYSSKGAVFLRVGNLDHGSVSLGLRNLQRVEPLESAEGMRTRVLSGDILISITADVGMVAIIREGFGEAYINQHIALASIFTRHDETNGPASIPASVIARDPHGRASAAVRSGGAQAVVLSDMV